MKSLSACLKMLSTSYELDVDKFHVAKRQRPRRREDEARGWKEEEREEKKTGGRTVKTCHRKWKVRDRED